MKKYQSRFKKPLILSCCVIVTLIFSAFATQPEPWWHDAQLEWKPFTDLTTSPTNPVGYTWNWEIRERVGSGTPKIFALAKIWNGDGKFFVANASAAPSFVEVNTTLPFGEGVTSTAMVRWDKSYDEFFVGSYTGIWKFDEDLGQFVSVWSWSWDPVFIRTLGDAIYGSVIRWGSKSGEHIWRPSGDTYLNNGQDALRTSLIWADPISQTYGYGDDPVRVISAGSSIRLTDAGIAGGHYRINSPSGLGPAINPIGYRNDGLDIYMNDFYEYSGTNILLEARYSGSYDLFIGNLGGTFYKINFPDDDPKTTMFYSPVNRLVIAGHAPNIYYTVLPDPNAVLGPTLNLQEAFIISWESKYGITNLESTTDLASGNWTTVTAPQNVVSNKIQVAVPKEQLMFFRLTSP